MIFQKRKSIDYIDQKREILSSRSTQCFSVIQCKVIKQSVVLYIRCREKKKEKKENLKKRNINLVGLENTSSQSVKRVCLK